MLLTSGTALGQVEEDREVKVDADGTSQPSPAALTAPLQDESWKREMIVALVGGGVRFLRIRLDVGDGSGGMEPRDLDTGAYFDFAWHLFIRPMGHRSPRPAIRAMVLQLDGGSSVGLEVESVDTGISLNANAWRMVGQFGYLYPIDRWQVGGLLGIGGDIFNIDLNSVMPSARILFVRLGPSGIVDLAGDFLMLRADFGLRFPFYLGELENAFGHDTRAFGLDSVLTLQGRIKAGFTYAFRLVWNYYTLRFAGPADNVPAMAEGGGGVDHAVNLQLLIGWSL
jgi:hypothetical protein